MGTSVDDLDRVIKSFAMELHADPKAIHAESILKSIAHVESNYGERSFATLHEPAYCYKGRYYVNSKVLRVQSAVWGCLAHSSFGPWQVLYISAYEFGYKDDPVLLRSPEVSIEYVIKILNARVMDKLKDEMPQDIFDAWNSGNPRDAIIPTEYINEALIHYSKIV